MNLMTMDIDDAPTPRGGDAPQRSRSAMDFDTVASLRNALQECCNTEQPNCGDWQIDNLDASTSVSQNLEEELARLEILKSYVILEEEREQSFERITGLASRIFDVPIALVSLVDLGRQWFMSNRGLGDVRETPRKVAFCAHAILSTQDILIVNDATLDPRFNTNDLVTGAPHIRFYAGAPLVCPEGYKLGTLCIIDSEPRPNGLTLNEKQNLRELAAMVIDTMVTRKHDREKMAENASHIIACTAHDLLTPLSGIQLSLSLVIDDEQSGSGVDQHSRELIQTAVDCSDMMSRICYQTIEQFRGDVSEDRRSRMQELQSHEDQVSSDGEQAGTSQSEAMEEGAIVISRLIENLRKVIEPYPKKVPLTIDVDEDVPPVIVSDDLKIFRSALNYITNACDKTESGVIHFRIYLQQDIGPQRPGDLELDTEAPVQTNGGSAKQRLVFQCTDTGPGIPVENYPNLFMPFGTSNQDQDRLGADHSRMGNAGLGLFSVASNISSLDGEYGFHPREDDSIAYELPGHERGDNADVITHTENNTEEVEGSVFWFSIPVVLPVSASKSAPALETQTKLQVSLENGENLAHAKQAQVTCTGAENGAQSMESVRNAADHGPQAKNDERVKQLTGIAENGGISLLSQSKKRPFPSPRADERPLKSALQDLDKKGEVTDVKGTEKEMHDTLATVSEDKGIDEKKLLPKALAGGIIDEGISEITTSVKRPKRAIVIDDSLTIRKSIDRALTRLGFEVTQAENGLEGLKQLKSTLFELVLCDFLMPVMDGLDCVQQYRAWESKHRPWFRQYIVGISAHASGSDAKRGIEVGMDKFLPKPVPLKTLKELSTSEKVMETSKQLDDKFAKTREAREREEQAFFQFIGTTPKFRDDVSESSVSVSTVGSLAPVCLIADDSVSVVKALKRCVESRGWRASVVENGEDALRLLKMRNWDAVLLDDQMPRLSGTSCVLQFRDWEAKNRVARQENIHLISSFYVPKEHSILPSGFDGAMGKPVKIKGLIELLDSISSNRGKQHKIVMH